MYLFMWESACVRVRVHRCKLVEAGGGGRSESSSITQRVFETGPLSNPELTNSARLASKLPGSVCLPPRPQGNRYHCVWLLSGCWESNSDLHPFIAGTTEPSPHPLVSECHFIGQETRSLLKVTQTEAEKPRSETPDAGVRSPAMTHKQSETASARELGV